MVINFKKKTYRKNNNSESHGSFTMYTSIIVLYNWQVELNLLSIHFYLH